MFIVVKQFKHTSLGGGIMAKVYAICGKSKIFGNKLTFSHRKINRTWSPNLRKVRAMIDGSVKRINICTNCIKSGKLEKPKQ